MSKSQLLHAFTGMFLTNTDGFGLYPSNYGRPDFNHPDPQHRFAATKRSARMSKKGKKR